MNFSSASYNFDVFCGACWVFIIRCSAFDVLCRNLLVAERPEDIGRNDAVEKGDRTRLACHRRRLAVDFVKPSFSPVGERSLLDEVCGGTPQTTRQRRVLPFFNCIVPDWSVSINAEAACYGRMDSGLFGF